MICPHCGIMFSPNWKYAYSDPCTDTDGVSYSVSFWYALKIAQCPAAKCKGETVYFGAMNDLEGYAEWDATTIIMVAPRLATRIPLGDAVPESIATDYREACSVLPISPKASAALSRRVLESILIDRGYETGDLYEKIQQVSSDDVLPQNLIEVIDVVRIVGNASAHSKNRHGIIAVDPVDAEWLLDIIERFISHFYTQPAEDAAIAAADKARAEALSHRTIST